MKKEKPRRKRFSGKVVSDKMEKTVVVEAERTRPHSLYRKLIKKRKRFYAENSVGAKMGDWVIIEECRPLSRTKRFITIEVIKGMNKKTARKITEKTIKEMPGGKTEKTIEKKVKKTAKKKKQ